MKIFLLITLVGCLLLLSCISYPLLAEETVYSGTYIVPSCVLSNQACNICDLINLVNTFAHLILGIISALALLMFVLGGYYIISSGGSQERVTKGKNILIAAITGILIVAFSFVAVNTVIGILLEKDITFVKESDTKLFPNGENIKDVSWWELPTCDSNQVETCSSDTAIGTACKSVNDEGGATGEKNSYCELDPDKLQAAGLAYDSDGIKVQEVSLSNKCGEYCKCMSLCDKVARDSEALKDYKCIPINDKADRKCFGSDLCPHDEGKDYTHKCCLSDK